MSNIDNPYQATEYPLEPLPPVSGMSVTSLVLGILSTVSGLFALVGGFVGMCCCMGAPVVVAPVAILLGIGGGVVGYFGMQECKTTGKRGHGLALAGIITSVVGVALGALVLVVIVGFMAFVAANQPPDQFNNGF